MRSQHVARAALRAASSSSSQSLLKVSARAIAAPQRLASTSGSATTIIALPRSFTTSSINLKKKNKKDKHAAAAASEVDEDPDAFADGEEFAVEEDDLFGGVSSSDQPSDSGSTSSPTSTSTSSSSSTDSSSRAEFSRMLEEWNRSLEWEVLDSGRFPPITQWLEILHKATSQTDLEEVIEAAKLYRERVRSLGYKGGDRFVAVSCTLGFPELALHALANRYYVGFEYNTESLYLIQEAFQRKLLDGDREEILASAEMRGAPAHANDLLGVVPPESAGAETAENQEAQEGDGKAEAISAEHELDMQLARAQLSIIDRMAMTAALASLHSDKGNQDPFLLANITSAYASIFHLSSKSAQSNPLLTKIRHRTNQLISLLVSSTQQILEIKAASVRSTWKVPSYMTPVYVNSITTTLDYVAKTDKDQFLDLETNQPLDPVSVLTKHLDHIAPGEVDDILKKINAQ